jgi:hypothetical protein
MAAGNLEEAAHAALASVRALRGHLGEARDACQESSGGVGTAAHHLETEGKMLHAAVDELRQAVDAAEQQLSEDILKSESALARVATTAHEAGTEGKTTLEAESSTEESLAQQLPALDKQLADTAEAVEAASRAALERSAAIEGSLGQIVHDVEQLLSTDLASALAELRQTVEASATAARALLEHDAPAALDKSEKDFTERMSEVRQVVDQAFADLERHAKEVADYSVEKFGLLIDHETDEMKLQTSALEADLGNLTRDAGQREAEVEHAAQALVEHMQANGESARALEEALNNVRGRWATFGFAI